MPEPIRVLHFADSHIGMENYGGIDAKSGLNQRVVDFLRRMDEIVAYARDHDADLIIFAGDAFKNRKPEPTLQREFAYRITDLAKIAPVVLLVGNHDLATAAAKASSIDIYHTLDVPNVWVGMDYEGRVIHTKRGDVFVATAPYPVRARLLERDSGDDANPLRSLKDVDEQIQGVMDSILDGLAQEADAHGDMPRLLTGHFAVSGAIPGAERALMLGRDIDVPKRSVADDRWDYVALGHIHKHQNLTHGLLDAPPVVYSGSIERIDFGEEKDPKGFCWVELAREETRWQFVELNARRFVTITCDLQSSNPTQDAIDAIKAKQASLSDAVVRVKLTFTPQTQTLFDENKVRDELKRNKAFFTHLIKDVQHPHRLRLGTTAEGLTHLQLLEQYFISQGVEAARREALLEAAKTLMHTDDSGAG